jgi:hypothetical protein
MLRVVHSAVGMLIAATLRPSEFLGDFRKHKQESWAQCEHRRIAAAEEVTRDIELQMSRLDELAPDHAPLRLLQTGNARIDALTEENARLSEENAKLWAGNQSLMRKLQSMIVTVNDLTAMLNALTRRVQK